MNYLIIALLLIRPFICEQANANLGSFFNIVFLCFFLLHILYSKQLQYKKLTFLISFIFPLFIFVSNFFSINSYNSQTELLRVLVLVLIFNFVYLQTDKQRDILIKGILGVSAIICLRVIYQYFFGIDFIKDGNSFKELTKNGFYAWELLLNKRAVSWFSSPNVLAGYLLLICPAACGYLLEGISEKNKKTIFVFSLLCFGLFLSLIFAKSISAFICFIISMVFIFLMIGKRSLKFTRYASILFVVFLLCFFSLFFRRSQVFVDFKNPQNSILQRAYYWKSSLEIIKEHSIVGIGAGNFKVLYPRFKHPKANETIYAHNSYLQIWAESGLLPLLSFLLLLAVIFKGVLTSENRLKDVGVIAGCFAVVIFNFTDYIFYIDQAAYIFWIFLAVVLSSSEQKLKTIELSFRKLLFFKVSYALMCAILLFNISLFCLSEKCVNKAIDYFKNKRYIKSLSLAETALHYKSNNDFAYYILACNFQMIYGDKFSGLAVKNYKTAISLNKNYSFYYYELAAYFFRHNQINRAKEYINLANKSYPFNSKFKSLKKRIFYPINK